ncbi:hypothetical protein [Thauera sp.]|uniref:baeRF3 domain-containing protein n=1 Tax=Thauera sp. TaxID=1905334 RepID=UPI0039B74721
MWQDFTLYFGRSEQGATRLTVAPHEARHALAHASDARSPIHCKETDNDPPYPRFCQRARGRRSALRIALPAHAPFPSRESAGPDSLPQSGEGARAHTPAAIPRGGNRQSAGTLRSPRQRRGTLESHAGRAGGVRSAWAVPGSGHPAPGGGTGRGGRQLSPQAATASAAKRRPLPSARIEPRCDVTVNPDAVSIEELRGRAWEVVEPEYRARLAALGEAFGQARANGLGSEALAEVAAAAVAGRGETLLIEADRLIAGHLDETTGQVVKGELDDPLVDDILDALGEMVVSKGGQVWVVPASRLPRSPDGSFQYRCSTPSPTRTRSPTRKSASSGCSMA